MAPCFASAADQPGILADLNTVTPQWVAQETGMTAARRAQRETPEVVAMETTPPCKCALLLETVASASFTRFTFRVPTASDDSN